MPNEFRGEIKHEDGLRASGKSPARRPLDETNDDSSMVVRNPAPDASPSRTPTDSRTFTVNC